MAKRKKDKNKKKNFKELTDLEKKLLKVSYIKDKCEDENCKIFNYKIKKIFSFENIKDKEKLDKLKSILKTSDNNINACDCIILCENERLIVLEILCGVLNSNKFNKKLKQIENCSKVVNFLKLNLCLKILAISKLDGNQKKKLGLKFTNLISKQIYVCYIDRIKENICEKELKEITTICKFK